MEKIVKQIYELCIDQGRYGYTIPYLFKIGLDSNSEISIEAMLKFLSKEKTPYIISHCNDLDEFIIGLHKKEYSPIEMYCHFGNLHYDQDHLGQMSSFDELIEYMTNIYQSKIDQKTFSKNPDTNKWE